MTYTTEPVATERPVGCCPRLQPLFEALALVVALGALAGSLYLSMGMGLQACPLCLYQRTFVFGVVTVLLLGWFLPALRGSGAASFLALPLAVGGLSVAGFHVSLEANQALICPGGLLGLGTAPQQSLAVLALLTVFVAGAAFASPPRTVLGRSAVGPSLAVVLGLALGWASIAGGPPPPEPKPLASVQQELDEGKLLTCKPVKP